MRDGDRNLLLAAQGSTLLSIKEGAARKILMDVTRPLESAFGGSLTKRIPALGNSRRNSTRNLTQNHGHLRIKRISSGDRTNFEELIDHDCFRSGDDKEFKITVAKLIERIPGVKVVNCRSLERGDHRKNHTTAIRTTAKKPAKTPEFD